MLVVRQLVVTLVTVATVCGCQTVRTAPTATQDVSTLRKQRKAEAVESFESQRTFAQLEAARSRLQSGDVAGCTEVVQSVLQREPENGEALALLHESRADDRADVADLPEDSAGERWWHEASAALEVGDVSTARHCLQQALAAQPNNRQLATSAAVLALRHHQPDLALQLAQSALPRFDDWAPLHRVIGFAHYRRGDFESSQLALQQALSLDNGHPLTYFLLGHTMNKLGDTDAAESCFVQASRANLAERSP